MSKQEILILGGLRAETVEGLKERFAVHQVDHMKDLPALLQRTGNAFRGAARGTHAPIDKAVFDQLPHLEILANFGVGYDGIDLKVAAERGIVVTNTPDVLTEEVADTALGLLLMTARELGAAERYLRAGRWLEGAYPLSATLRDRSVGIVGLGRIGKAIARRLEAFGLPVAYHNRRPQDDVHHRYYPDLMEMARDVDTLISVLPGGASTDKLIGRAVLDAALPNPVITGVNQECVFTNINFSIGSLIRQDEETSQYYQDYLAACKDASLQVYLTEYAPKYSLIEKTIRQYCVQNGFHYYLSNTIELDGA